MRVDRPDAREGNRDWTESVRPAQGQNRLDAGAFGRALTARFVH